MFFKNILTPVKKRAIVKYLMASGGESQGSRDTRSCSS
jgi:hypothetical protein